MPDPTPNRPPLWQVMADARPPGLTTQARFWMYERDCFAAEIRALADWLVPEEPEPPDGYAETSAGYRHTVWEVHDELRDRLLAEADRAEAGE